MSGISHKQARNFMRADLDGLLTEAQHHDFEGHLNECEACRVEAESLSILTARLRSNFQGRWDTQDGPSKNVAANVHSQTRRIIMSNRIRFGMRTLAGVGALVLLGFVFNFVFSQFRNTSIRPGEINPTVRSTPAGLIAFVSGKEAGNEEIYTMNADGSGLTNITNDLATDTSPAWSPDGKRIAFGSDRNGDMDIYVMDADGSKLTKLTDHSGFEGNFSWSPDGQKIIYTASDNSLNYDGQLIIMNADGSNKTTLTNEPGSYDFLGWSPDGQRVIYQKAIIDPNNGSGTFIGLYIVNVDGTDWHKWVMGSGQEWILGEENIQWQDLQHFLGVNTKMNSEGFPVWSIYQFGADDNLPLELASSNTPIVALFEKTYVVEGQTDLLWYSSEGAPTPLSSWSFAEICKTPGDLYHRETYGYISPNKKYSFVNAYCRDDKGSVSFLLINEDGTEIHRLGMPITNTNIYSSDVSWSPNGDYVTVMIAHMKGDTYIGADLYLFDIEKMLNDLSTQPIQLTTDGKMKYEAVWQPQP